MAATYEKVVALQSRRMDDDNVMQRMFQRFVDRRMAKARGMVAEYLQLQDDETLKRLGYDEKQIARLRRR